MLKVIIDDGRIIHHCQSMTAARILCDVARRLGSNAVIEGYLY